VGSSIAINKFNQQIQFSRVNNILQTKVFDLDDNGTPDDQLAASIDNSNIYVDMYSTSEKTQAYAMANKMIRMKHRLQIKRFRIGINLNELLTENSTTLETIGDIYRLRFKISLEIKKAKRDDLQTQESQLVNGNFKLLNQKNILFAYSQLLLCRTRKLIKKIDLLSIHETSLEREARKLIKKVEAQKDLSQFSTQQQDSIIFSLRSGTRGITALKYDPNSGNISGFTIE